MFAKKVLFLCFFVLAVFCFFEAKAEVTASVSSIAVTENGNITLTIKDDASAGENPDLKELRRAFKILTQRKVVRNSYVDGVANMLTEWSYVISPKDKKGKTVIPAITVGKETTEPIEIQILTAEEASKNAPEIENTTTESDEVFLRVAVENETPYVQGQVIYVARLYSKYRIAEGALISPNMENAIVERLGEDLEFTTKISGQNFRVVERRFAIFPQVSGEMVIPPAEFTGSVVDSKSRNPIGEVFADMGIPRMSMTMATIARPVRILSDTLTINVLPKPKEAEGKWWLPAYAMRITDAWEPNPPVFKENEAVKRTIRIEAAGLTASQLPDIPIPEDDTLKVYPGKVDVKNNASDRGIIGEVKKSVVLIPTQAGKIVLPEIKLEWWNVMTKKMEEVVLPKREFEVKGVSKKTSSPQETVTETFRQSSGETSLGRSGTIPEEVYEKKSENSQNLSLFLLIGGFIGIVCTLLFLFFAKAKGFDLKNKKQELKTEVKPVINRNLSATEDNANVKKAISESSLNSLNEVSDKSLPVTEKIFAGSKKSNSKNVAFEKTEKTLRQAMQDLEQKAKLKNPKEFRDALMLWARLYFKDAPVLNLVEIAKRLKSTELQKALEELNKSLYAGKEVGFNGEALMKLLHTALDKQKKDAKKIKPVPDLYPTTK